MKKTNTTKRAFTLVELLAVIVILAIILVIAVPQIMNTIEKSKKGAMESSAKLVASELELKYNTALTTGDEFDTTGSCMSYGNLDDDEYASCTYTIDTNGKASITLTGKTGGKFDGLSATGTKVSATCENVYTITLNANGGTISSSSIAVVVGSAYGTLPTPTYSNHVFLGWYTASSGGTKVESTDISTGDVTIYAHWANSQFEADSWATIKTNVHNGTTTAYHVGDTKSIDLGDLGTHTVRIANMSSDWEYCGSTGVSEGYSQTACGFVVEFVDIITEHAMNSTATNEGGYPASEMYTYINNTIYPEIKAVTGDIIVDTIVVSGHKCASYDWWSYTCTSVESNFSTTDKVYLLSAHEVWADGTSQTVSRFDTAYNNTRQLDYYANLGLTTDDYSGGVKQYNGSATSWWLRTATSADNLFFENLDRGGWSGFHSDIAQGVSPAFRIA